MKSNLMASSLSIVKMDMGQKYRQDGHGSKISKVKIYFERLWNFKLAVTLSMIVLSMCIERDTNKNSLEWLGLIDP